MILENKQSMVAYRCPHCGGGVMSVVGLFNLHAEAIRLKCTCKQSSMTLNYSAEGKIRFVVPCILCPTPHTFTLSSPVFFNRDLFVLPCPYTDLNICMIGNENKVKAELSRTELELLDILDETGLTSFEDLNRQNSLSDPEIRSIVLYVIQDLDADGKIYCNCKDDIEGDYEVDINHSGIFIKCKKCSASKTLPANSFLSAHEFLNADKLVLE